MYDFKDKVALVTGAARGLGLECAKELLRNGLKGVSIVDINDENGVQAVEEISKECGRDRAVFFECDITQSDNLKGVFKNSFERWKRLDILINNAGIADEQNWTKLISLNCCAVVTATYLGYDYMSTLENGSGGVIVNISSHFGLYPKFVVPVYSAAKSFIAAFGCAMGSDPYYKHNKIRLITVCPGAMDTFLLKNVTDNVLDRFCPNARESFTKKISEFVVQKPEYVAKEIVKIITTATNGSMWSIVSNKPPVQVEFGRHYEVALFINTTQMFDIKDKVALVTGAAKGLGLGCVKQLLRNGLKGVSIVDVDVENVNVENGMQVVGEISKEYGHDRVVFFECDITQSDKLREVFENSFEHWKRLDILINNAGTVDEQNWTKSISLNSCAVVAATYLGFEYMSTLEKGNGGVIVNISSYFGLHPTFMLPAYSATVSFIAAFGCAMGTDPYYVHNKIRVITVCPGAIETDLLKNFTDHMLDRFCPDIHERVTDELRKFVLQKPEYIAKEVVKIITTARNGSMWSIVNNKPPTQVEFGRHYEVALFINTTLMFDIKDKVALVTGAAKGLGLGCAMQLLRNGLKGVSIVDIDVENGVQAVEEITKEYGHDRVVFFECDITQSDKLKEVFKNSFEHWKRLDILINNAGTVSEQNWSKLISLNCCAVVTATYLGFEYMSTLENGNGGVIVNISSHFGLHPTFTLPSYSATKSFIAAFGCAMGTDPYYVHNKIRVITMCPGAIETDLFKNLTDHLLDRFCPDVREKLADKLSKYVVQKPEYIAKEVVNIINTAKNGSMWSIFNNKPPIQVEFGRHYEVDHL
ncbi:hypothetical protein FQA39_LY15196 [Lamprigera yunnana]|nr:hypothetical protein FQA39_LY15196 [Lamprigera yunnana]